MVYLSISEVGDRKNRQSGDIAPGPCKPGGARQKNPAVRPGFLSAAVGLLGDSQVRERSANLVEGCDHLAS